MVGGQVLVGGMRRSGIMVHVCGIPETEKIDQPEQQRRQVVAPVAAAAKGFGREDPQLRQRQPGRRQLCRYGRRKAATALITTTATAMAAHLRANRRRPTALVPADTCGTMPLAAAPRLPTSPTLGTTTTMRGMPSPWRRSGRRCGTGWDCGLWRSAGRPGGGARGSGWSGLEGEAAAAAAAAAAANTAGATKCCGRNAVTTATSASKRLVGVGLLLLSAVIVIGCAVGYRNSRSGSSQPNQRPGLGERPLEEDGALPATGALTPTAAPTPWTVPAFQPTVPVGSSPHMCTSPINELWTDGIQSDDKLGTSVAMDRAGTIVVAGAPNADNLGSNAGMIASLDTGAVFVYDLRANGGDMQDAQVTKLVASDSVRGMGFGTSVDISNDGNVIVIGAPSADVNFIDKVGAAYVFRRDALEGIFREEARLVPSVSITRMQFGRSVAINEDGSRIVVGAPGGRRIANGSVTVYSYKSDGGWAYTTHVQDDTSDESMFGLSVDISNNNIVVGAPLAGFQMEGAAYLYSGDAAWDEVAMLSGFDGRDEFGVDVSIDGDRIAIGSQFANTQFGFDSGSVFLYTKNNDNGRWEPEVQISRVGMVTQGYKFGNSVDLTGSRLIAGAPGNSAAYVFAFEDDAWKETQRIEHPGGSFATSVAASSGATIAVGDPSQDENAGATFVIDNCHV